MTDLLKHSLYCFFSVFFIRRINVYFFLFFFLHIDGSGGLLLLSVLISLGRLVVVSLWRLVGVSAVVASGWLDRPVQYEAYMSRV
jgi:hypothetical protein